jgi:hypothetical protein
MVYTYIFSLFWYWAMSVHAIQSYFQCWYYDYSLLSRIYVSINAFRSLFPVKIVERECYTDFSTPFIDRSLATISEICFAKQLSLKFRDDRIFYYACLAQVFCWTGMLTQNNLYHVYEEYLWFLIGYLCYWKATNFYIHVISFMYCCYMICIDIPMYFMRFIEQDLITMYDMHDCMLITELSTMEMLWRTGYFVGASRLSMNV